MKQEASEEKTDQALMRAVADGDVAQLGLLFDRHHKQLFNFLLRITGDRQLSEDFVQEVFVRILKYRHTWHGDFGFRGWMFQIARNVRMDYARRNTRLEVNIDDHETEFICQLPTPDTAVEWLDDMRITQEALRKIPEERREVMLLRGFQGLKFEEIAEVQKCSVNTVKGRAFRAIRELRDIVRQLRQEGMV